MAAATGSALAHLASVLLLLDVSGAQAAAAVKQTAQSTIARAADVIVERLNPKVETYS
jgi:hypothetical protein